MNPFKQAEDYARKIYQNFSPDLIYHNSRHAQDVRSAAKKLGKLESKNPHELKILDIAALYHDIGFIETYEGHEDAGIRMIHEHFPHFGFSEDDISLVTGLVRATKLPQRPLNSLEEILCDADLDNFGRTDFFINTELLFQERCKNGFTQTSSEWLSQSLELLKSHEYFTENARNTHHVQKQKNLKLLEEKVAKSRV